MHHLLYNYLSQLFEPMFIDDSYACRKGYGTLKDVERLEQNIRSCTENFTKQAYVLKLDLQGNFMSINRKVLYDLIEHSLLRPVSLHKVPTKGSFNLKRVLYLQVAHFSGLNTYIPSPVTTTGNVSCQTLAWYTAVGWDKTKW